MVAAGLIMITVTDEAGASSQEVVQLDAEALAYLRRRQDENAADVSQRENTLALVIRDMVEFTLETDLEVDP